MSLQVFGTSPASVALRRPWLSWAACCTKITVLNSLTILPPQNVDGVSYLYIKGSGLLFVATTKANVAPSLVLELLHRCARVAKDYLGVLNEDSLRKNFVLVYELLDEMIVRRAVAPG